MGPTESRFRNFDSLVAAIDRPRFLMLQVGANDGVTDDDVRKYVLARGWHAVLVEPLPDVFDRLRRNYADHAERLTFVRAAVCGHDGTVEFLRHPTLPQCSGLSVRTKIQQRSAMERLEVPAVSWGTLLSGPCGGREIDLLQIDVEGHDADLLMSFPLGDGPEQRLPRAVRCEHKHMTGGQLADVYGKFADHGYASFAEGPDLVLYRPPRP